MPYILSHTSFAYLLGEKLNCFSDRDSLSLYMLGSLGPDVFFFDRIPPTPFVPNQKKIGNSLHKVPCDRLAASLLLHAPKQLLPYVYGFFTHIALDSTMHPYVCALYHGTDHTRFEGDIDAVFYERYKDAVPFASLFKKPRELALLDSLLTRVADDTIREQKPHAYARSVRKLLRMYPILFDPKGHRFRFVHAIERVFGKAGAVSAFLLAAPRQFFNDCMNEQHSIWYAETFPSIPRTESVDELFAEAKVLAQRLIQSAQKGDVAAVCSLCANRTMDAGPTP